LFNKTPPLEQLKQMEQKYLRCYADLLLKRVLPTPEYESCLVREFLTELLTQMVFVPVLGFCTPPEINKVLE
jgi:hypothetical protein